MCPHHLPCLPPGGCREMKTNQITPDSLPPGTQASGQGGQAGWVGGGGGSRLIHCERLDVQRQLRGAQVSVALAIFISGSMPAGRV